MNAWGARLNGLVGGADAALLRLRNQLTPGQRWTAALALTLTIAVLLYGAPKIVTNVARPSSAFPAAEPGAAGEVAPAELPYDTLVTPGPEAVIDDPGTVAAPAPLPLRVPSIVAVVRAAGTSLPARDDASIANVFVAASGLTVGSRTLDPANAGFCADTAAAGEVVLASEGLDAGLRDCLVNAGRIVVAFDPLGDAPAREAPATGQVLSTRRGIEATVSDVAKWGARGGALAGRLGVVGHRSAKAQIDAAIAAFPSRLDVVATAYLDDTSPNEVPDAVQAFAARGVQVVLFAVPVDFQRRFVAQAAVLGPGMRYVVADTFDSVTQESYPPTFDGALAYTSLRVPWFARSKGETPAQVACRRTWEASAVPPVTLSGLETIRVFAWCQHVALVAAAVDGVAVGRPFAESVRTQRVASPLTSDLAPLAEGGYGPSQNAVLVWRASCGCWAEAQPYADR